MMWRESLIFIGLFYFIMLVPCLSVGWLGFKLLDKLGRYPSKTPAIQMGIILKLVTIEVVSFTLLLLFFKVLVSE